jgi:RHS repeat-associated protein
MTKDFVFLGNKRIAFVSLASGNAYYYLSDHLGSTAVIGSGDGKTIQWEADYFPFGSERQVFTSSVNNSYQFTGYEYDSDTQYNYAVARFDAGRWGKFLSPDPYLGSMDIGNPQSMNRYSYVMNMPTELIDATGLDKVKTSAVHDDESCTLNGMMASCDLVKSLVNSGVAATCPNNDCGMLFSGSQNGWVSPLRTGSDGQWQQFYIPGFNYTRDNGFTFGLATGIWINYNSSLLIYLQPVTPTVGPILTTVGPAPTLPSLDKVTNSHSYRGYLACMVPDAIDNGKATAVSIGLAVTAMGQGLSTGNMRKAVTGLVLFGSLTLGPAIKTHNKCTDVVSGVNRF